MARKTLKGVGVAAWLATYSVLAIRSGWGMFPIVGLVCGLVVFARDLKAAARYAGRFLEDVFDVGYLLVDEFRRAPILRKDAHEEEPIAQPVRRLPIRERAKAKRAA